MAFCLAALAFVCRYFSPKTKQIMSKKVARKAQGGHGELKLKPIFAQFVLGPIWQVRVCEALRPCRQ